MIIYQLFDQFWRIKYSALDWLVTYFQCTFNQVRIKLQNEVYLHITSHEKFAFRMLNAFNPPPGPSRKMQISIVN